MNSMQICVTSESTVGCTFLDWSIHFLSGQTNFFNTKHGWIPLSKNPMTKINAHGHLKNHPSGLIETQDVIANLQKQNKLTSFYPFKAHADKIAQQLNINFDSMSPDQWQSIQDYLVVDYNQLLFESYSCGAKVIFVSLDKNLLTYSTNFRTFESAMFKKCHSDTIEDIRNAYDQTFFKDVEIWKDHDLTNIWDIRERRALANNVLQYNLEQVDLQFDHYWLDAQNLWYNGKREIQKIMTWLNLPLIQERFTHWVSIYDQWQQLQIDLLQFEYNYKHMVKSIVNNWSFPIDLTFDQEVIIQHCLIYQHGLNLKTWQLEKFPSNTQALHKLLEPNIHPL
jgi:hypothetical protein